MFGSPVAKMSIIDLFGASRYILLLFGQIFTFSTDFMEFPRAPFAVDAIQPPSPPTSPIGGPPTVSTGTVKLYDPDDTCRGWPKPPPGRIVSCYQAMLDDWDAEKVGVRPHALNG